MMSGRLWFAVGASGLLLFAFCFGGHSWEASRHEPTWPANDGFLFGAVMGVGAFAGMCLFAVGIIAATISRFTSRR